MANQSDKSAGARKIESEGGRAIFVKCDVSNESDVKALVNRTIETFGRLDFAFNNAGIVTGHPTAVDGGWVAQ